MKRSLDHLPFLSNNQSPRKSPIKSPHHNPFDDLMTLGNLKPIAHKSKFTSQKPSGHCVFPLLSQKSPISIAKVSSEKLIRTKMNFFRCYSKSPRNTRKELERLDTPRFLEVGEEFNDISLEPA